VIEFEDTIGFAVRDPGGRIVGLVEAPLYGTWPERPDALAMRSGWLVHHHFVVPADAIAGVDPEDRMIDLRLDRERLLRFL
jgi:hypothetical protein